MKTDYFPWSEQRVFEALRVGHFVEGSTVLLPQVRAATGASAERTVDAIAMQIWPSRGLTIEGVEIKTARSDFLRELAQPEKSDGIAAFCSKWWIAAPHGVVTDGDLEGESWPVQWGWLEVRAKIIEAAVEGGKPTIAYSVKVRRRAKENEAAREPTRAFLASILRSLQSHESPDAIANRRAAEMAQKQRAVIEAAADKRCDAAEEQLREIRSRVQAFEYATGMTTGVFSSAWNGKTIAQEHEESRRRMQIACSLERFLTDATALADQLSTIGDRIVGSSKTMKAQGEKLRQFIAGHVPEGQKAHEQGDKK
jgi:hypothetical protein